MCSCGGVPPGGVFPGRGALLEKIVPGDVISVFFSMRSVKFLRPAEYLLLYPHLPKQHQSPADPRPWPTGSLQDVRSARIQKPPSDVLVALSLRLGDNACRSPKPLLGPHRKLMVGRLAKNQIADQSSSRAQCAAVTVRKAAQHICDLWLPTEGPGQQISTPLSIRLRPCGHAVSQGVTICWPSRQKPKLWWNSGHAASSPRLEKHKCCNRNGTP